MTDEKGRAMVFMLLYTITVLLTVVTRPITGRWVWGYWTGGFIFGLFNEFCFSFCWTYSAVMGPAVSPGIPILILLAWGSMAMLAMGLSDRLVQCWGGRWASLQGLVDVILFAMIGYAAEVLLYSRGCWQYNFPLHKEPAVQIFFYTGAGLLISSTGRRIDAWFRHSGRGKERSKKAAS